MYKFKETVYVKKGNYGWVATYIDADQFIEVRPQNSADMPKKEGYYQVLSDKGFRTYTGPTGKLSIYGNGNCTFVKTDLNDESLSEIIE